MSWLTATYLTIAKSYLCHRCFVFQKRNQCKFLFYVCRFLKEHKCKANVTEQRIETGFARWTVVFIKCRNIDDTVITTVLCEKRCIDPATCRKMPGRKYHPIAIITEIPVTDRNDITTYLKVPTSCQCTAKKRKCKKSSKSKRRSSCLWHYYKTLASSIMMCTRAVLLNICPMESHLFVRLLSFTCFILNLIIVNCWHTSVFYLCGASQESLIKELF